MSDIDFLKKGKELLESGNIEESVKYLDKAYANDPDNDKILNILGLAYYKSGRLENAYQIYRKLINKSPENSILRLNIGVLLYKKKEYSLAIDELAIAEKLDPDNQKINYFKGMCYEAERKFDKAIIEYEKSNSPKNIEKVKQKQKARKSKFKVKDDSVEINRPSTEDILYKHFGNRNPDLENIENEDDIDKVLIEKDSSNTNDNFFDPSQLASADEDEAEEETETSSSLYEEYYKGSSDKDKSEDDLKEENIIDKKDSTQEILREVNNADFPDIDMQDIEDETNKMVKEFYNYENNSNTPDSFDEKVEDFFKTHKIKEDEEYKNELMDSRDDYDLQDAVDKSEEPQESESEEEMHEKRSPEIFDERNNEENDSIGQITQYHKDDNYAVEVDAFNMKEDHKTASSRHDNISIHSVITLEALTREYNIKDDPQNPVIPVSKNIILYYFLDNFLFDPNLMLASSGNISDYHPDDDSDHLSIHEELLDKYYWISGEGRLFIKLNKNVFIPVKLFGDEITVNTEYIIGVDGKLIKDLKNTDGISLMKLEGAGYFLISSDSELISVSIDDGHKLQCSSSAFLGYMGLNEPSIIKDTHNSDIKIRGKNKVIQVSGPGIAFLLKEYL